MTPEEHYEALRNRYQCVYFKQDEIPERSLIEKILTESLLATPVFSNIYDHKVEVFGPEYADDKYKLCRQTLDQPAWMMAQHDAHHPKHKISSNIEDLDVWLDTYIERIEEGLHRDFSNGGVNDMFPDEPLVTFNTQVMAPWLLKFSISPRQYDPTQIGIKEDSPSTIESRAREGSVAQAYSIAIIARHYGLAAGFCRCFFASYRNPNRIGIDMDRTALFLGLGYQSEWCPDSPGSKHRRLKIEGDEWKNKPPLKPQLEDVVTFK